MATHGEIRERGIPQRARLRLALRSGDVLGAARAWERLRVDPNGLDRSEVAAARAARATVGRAIRDARRRRARATVRPAQSATVVRFPLESAFARFQGGISAAVTLLLVFSLFLVMTPSRPEILAPAAAPELTTVAQPELTRAVTGGRGRTSATLAPVAVATTPQPTPQPTAAPTVAVTSAPRTGAPAATASTGGVPGGAPGGVPGGVPSGTPGGVVSGVPGATGRLTPSPSPSVYVLPLNPPTLLGGADRFMFRVVDSRTGAPLSNVCVIYGTITCEPKDPHTNLLGYFWLDLTPPAASNWSFRFSLDGYVAVTVNKTYRPRQGTVVTTVDLRRR